MLICHRNADILERSGGKEIIGPATVEEIITATFRHQHAALIEALEKSQLAFMNVARLARFESKASLEAVAQLRHCEERNRAALQLAKEGTP